MLSVIIFTMHKTLEQIKNFTEENKKPLLVVLGPTASGKTALSLKIAKTIGGEIISTDSRQIYRQMRIGTDVIMEDQQEGVPHHLLEIRNPDETLSLAEYKDLAEEKIDEIYKRGNIPMLVGGTGLYISAITQNYELPRIPPNLELREELEGEAKEKGNQYVHDILKKLDLETAEKIHPNNLRYVIRAIEIAREVGKKRDSKKESTYQPFYIGINWPREELYKRVNLRVEIQLNRGLVEEVKQLIGNNYDENLASMSSLGVKEIMPFLRGESSLEECVETLKQNTRHYAKRQISWFKRYKDVKWLSPLELKEITE